jgi:hypothetical protein
MTMEVIEGTAVEVPVEGNGGWQGDFPFFLVIEPEDRSGGNVGIDLDEPGWVDANRDLMRAPGTWLLYLKESQRPLFCIIVEPGDQPYFTRHHVGNLMAGSNIMAVGIGKKSHNGEMTRLWLLPNGMVCGGDDVDIIASRMLR